MNSCRKITRVSTTVAYAAFAFLALGSPASLSLAAVGKLDTAKIEQLTGAKGELNEKEGVFTVRVPRTDLQVTTAGVKMNPAMGLTSYAAFMKVGVKTMVMGDTTLLEDQVNPVMTVRVGERPGSYSPSQPFFLGFPKSHVHAHRWHG
jgi:Domain of Unknown Function (DUF1259)